MSVLVLMKDVMTYRQHGFAMRQGENDKIGIKVELAVWEDITQALVIDDIRQRLHISNT